MPFNTKDLIEQKTDSLTVSDQLHTYDRINAYCVYPDGRIAVSGHNYINVFQSDGSFLCCYEFDTVSGAYALEADSDSLWLYFLRTKDIVHLYEDGTAVYYTIPDIPGAKKESVQMEVQRMDSQMRRSIAADGRYFSINSTLTELTVQDADGDITSIYHTNAGTVAGDWILSGIIILCAVTCLTAHIKNHREMSEEEALHAELPRTSGTDTADSPDRHNR